MEMHEAFEAMVRDKTGGLLMTNVSVTDPDGGFHCACTNSNIAHSSVFAGIAANLEEMGQDAGSLGSLATEEDDFFIASVISDIHVMKDKAVSNLKVPFSAKVIGIPNPLPAPAGDGTSENPDPEMIAAFTATMDAAAAWIGIKFLSVADEVQTANEAARREGQSAASALAGVEAAFMADARVDGWSSWAFPLCFPKGALWQRGGGAKSQCAEDSDFAY